jgi:hypothetical protein
MSIGAAEKPADYDGDSLFVHHVVYKRLSVDLAGFYPESTESSPCFYVLFS